MKFSRIILLSLAAAALAGCSTSEVDLESRSINVQQTAQPAGGPLALGTASLVSHVGPSYVTLTISTVFDKSDGKARDNTSAVTSGSGFVVDSKGYVMTAGHVAVKTGNLVSARAANGRVYSGSVVDVLPGHDLALIKLRGFKGQSAVPVANGCLAKGATLFSLGKPHAQGDTARFGTVESMSFGHPVQYGKFGYPDAMVMRMSTQKGESGGPVFDGNGKLAGMVVSTLSDGNGNPINLAHAVPAAELASFLCSQLACTGDWQVLARQPSSGCPAI